MGVINTRIAIYFKSSHVERWSVPAFEAGLIPLSGTDALILRVALGLARRGLRINLYSDSLPEEEFDQDGFSVSLADGAERAVVEAKAGGCELGVFSVRNPEAVTDLVRQAEMLQLPLVLWDQNGPEAKLRNMLFHSPVVRRLVTVSASQADVLRDHPLFYKTSVVPNFIPTDFWSGGDDIREFNRVSFVGSLTPSKGFQHVAKAWPEVRKRMPNASLEVVGSARLYDSRATLGPLGIGEPEFEQKHLMPYLGATRDEAAMRGVVFHGLLTPQKLREVLLKSALVVVNPNCSSSGETFCVSAAEASAAGAAVIGANRMGLRETVSNLYSGYLIDREDQLALAITMLLLDRSGTRQMGANGRTWVREKFAPEHILPKWLEVIGSSLKGELPKPVPFSMSRLDLHIGMREFLRVGKIFFGRKYSEFSWASLKRVNARQ